MVAYSPYDWSMPIAAASIANTVKMAAATRIMPLLNTICAMAKPAMAETSRHPSHHTGSQSDAEHHEHVGQQPSCHIADHSGHGRNADRQHGSQYAFVPFLETAALTSRVTDSTATTANAAAGNQPPTRLMFISH